jgi:hypothetical protein
MPRQPRSRAVTFLLAAWAISFTLTCLGQIGESSPEVDDESAAESFLEQGHERLSKGIEAMLRGADSLFSGNSSYDAPTGSYVQLVGKTIQQRASDGGSQYDLTPRAKISLPKTTKRLQLLLEEDLPNADLTESQRDAQAAAGIQPRDFSQYLGLRGIAIEKLKLQLTTDVGVKIRSLRDPFARVRGQRVFTVGGWTIPLSETLLYRRLEKTSATTELGLLKPWGETYTLSMVSDATWRQTTRAFDLSEYVTLSHQPNPRTLVAAELGVYGQTEPNTRALAYSAALRYRHKIYSDWVVMEIRPQLLYTRDKAFRPVPSITLQIEGFFGDRYFEGLQ